MTWKACEFRKTLRRSITKVGLGSLVLAQVQDPTLLPEIRQAQTEGHAEAGVIVRNVVRRSLTATCIWISHKRSRVLPTTPNEGTKRSWSCNKSPGSCKSWVQTGGEDSEADEGPSRLGHNDDLISAFHRPCKLRRPASPSDDQCGFGHEEHLFVRMLLIKRIRAELVPHIALLATTPACSACSALLVRRTQLVQA